MRISDIKTIDQLDELADNWYNRTFKLKSIWENKNETPKRIIKAMFLWNIMKNRIFNLTHIYIKINTPKNPPEFIKGGVINNKNDFRTIKKSP